MLDQAGQAGAGHVDRRAGALRLGTVIAEGSAIAIRIHVPVLPVLAIVVHGEGLLRVSNPERRRGNLHCLCETWHSSVRGKSENKGRRPDTVGEWNPPVYQIHMYHGIVRNCIPFVPLRTMNDC